ncbi:MAG: hypothetical protein EA409_03120 [Saprospirales bacterium]|nr:MAG: hypothetical protein EA409_03120 [Saprospirales bacterium]
MKKKEFDLIERYLDGSLTESEKYEFESRVISDQPLKNKLEAHRAARQVLKELERNELRAQFKKYSQEKKGIASNDGPKIIRLQDKIKRTLRYAAAVAILVTFTGLSFLVFDSHRYGSSVFAEMNTREYLTIERSVGSTDEAKIIEIRQLYISENWTATIEQIVAIGAETQSLSPEILLILADAKYKSGDLNGAQEIYRSVQKLESIDEWFIHQAEWKELLLALEKKPFDPIFKGQLKDMASDENHLYKQLAANTLDQMQSWRFKIGQWFF